MTHFGPRILSPLALAVLLVAALAPHHASACSCVALSPQAVADQAWSSTNTSIIFEGTVTSTMGVYDNPQQQEINATFSVHYIFKGTLPTNTVTVTTGANSAMCGVNFTVGQRWFLTLSQVSATASWSATSCGFNCVGTSSVEGCRQRLTNACNNGCVSNVVGAYTPTPTSAAAQLPLAIIMAVVVAAASVLM